MPIDVPCSSLTTKEESNFANVSEDTNYIIHIGLILLRQGYPHFLYMCPGHHLPQVTHICH